MPKKTSTTATVQDPIPDKEVLHGISEAWYAGGPGHPYYQPVMDCLCGWSTGRQPSWETAGEYLDSHLEESINATKE